MKLRGRPLRALAAFVFLPLLSSPGFGEESMPVAPQERAALIEEQNWLRVLRAFEQESRHLYFLQSNAMLSVYGGWSKDDFTYGNHILLLKEAVDNFFLPNVNRLQAQLDRGKWADVADAERLAEAVTQMLAAINVSLEIFEFLQTGDLASANAIYRERSVPLFKAIWASNSTLISAAERRFPRW